MFYVCRHGAREVFYFGDVPSLASAATCITFPLLPQLSALCCNSRAYYLPLISFLRHTRAHESSSLAAEQTKHNSLLLSTLVYLLHVLPIFYWTVRVLLLCQKILFGTQYSMKDYFHVHILFHLTCFIYFSFIHLFYDRRKYWTKFRIEYLNIFDTFHIICCILRIYFSFIAIYSKSFKHSA